MLIRNKRPYDVELPQTGEIVEAGDVVDVDSDLGASLVEQEDAWEAADGKPTVKDILDDVGGDPDRARTALALEIEAEKPRRGLIKKLEDIAATTEENV